jgi:NAD(P) transhydrogenase
MLTSMLEVNHRTGANAVLVAAGRQSNTAHLGLEKAGVKTGTRGLVPVNEHFQTNIENIYAAGDAIGFPALASTSMEQARRAALHALNLPGRTISPLLPAGIYTIPEVSMVGETEESLQKKGTAYVVGRANYRENARVGSSAIRMACSSCSFVKAI